MGNQVWQTSSSFLFYTLCRYECRKFFILVLLGNIRQIQLGADEMTSVVIVYFQHTSR